MTMKKVLLREKKLIIVVVAFISIIYFFTLISGFSINMSPSVERGVYILYPKINLKKGDIINFKIPKEIKIIALERNYLTKNIKSLTKYIVADEGDIVERKNNKIYINNIYTATIYKTDSNNRELSSVFSEEEKIKLKKGEYFILGITENSLDSRYFGIIKYENIIKKSKLIIPFD